ncbi:MAG: ATPase [Cellvibrio sp. 79]|nr:MAG: ATPase [Cellvibrio sp. 79]
MNKISFVKAGLWGIGLLCASQSVMAACIYKISSEWSTGLIGEITVTNNGSNAVNSWSVGWQYANNRVSGSWNATITGSNPYVANNLNWNGGLQPGQSATFGVQVEKNGSTADVPVITGSLCNGVVSSISSSAPISSSRSSSSVSSSSSVIVSSSKSSSLPVSSSSKSSLSSSSVSTNVSILLEENQTGFCAVNGTIDSNNAGFTGAGFANSTNAVGAGVDWSINVKTAGAYRFKWRYAATAARSADLIIDGNIISSNIIFPASGAWTTWVDSNAINLNLEAGTHKIRLQAAGSEGLVNVDSLTVSGANLTPANCDTISTPISLVNPSFTNIAVHDPSVIFANNQYYVFGSHLSVAKSPDLMRWTRVAEGVNSSNSIFNNVNSELSEALSWAQTTTLWAPDVAYVNGRYLMYYNACKGDSPVSALGIASSSKIEGPYSDKGLILRSGMWGQISEDGTVYNALVHPNTVDPSVFYDNSNRLWMIYGSYSGGIFIMQLNASTGFPLSGQGYGKHLMGGNHSVIEGAYVIYSPETNYYYMFVSFGGLDAAGGYNIRVSRSRNPNGPYVDAKGTDMRNVKANPNVPLFDTASLAPHGVKLMGNYVFANTNNQLGYVSPGHNSAYRKPATGQYFLVFHTRFPGRGEEHEVRTHEFFFNTEGWPVVSPLRYAEKIDANDPARSRSALEAVAANEIPGTYQLINHGKEISATIKSSSNIQLASGGVITGTLPGSWTFDANTRATTVVLGGITYRGVISRQWNQVRTRFEVTFTALSGDGTAVWGIKSN